MGSLTFTYGTMSSGKTTLLLQSHYNLNSAFPGEVALINKFDRAGENVCTSRIGAAQMSVGLHNGDSVIDVIHRHEELTNSRIKFILVDEVQFFLPRQVEELAVLADTYDKEVHAFGLLTTYKGRLFEASKRLLELADESKQINNEIRCWCGKRATHNALYVSGEITTSGEDNIVDNDKSIAYEVLCRKHFVEASNFSSSRNRNGNRNSVSI